MAEPIKYTVALDRVAHATFLVEAGAVVPSSAETLGTFDHGGDVPEAGGAGYKDSHALIYHIDDLLFRKAGIHSTQFYPVQLVKAA